LSRHFAIFVSIEFLVQDLQMGCSDRLACLFVETLIIAVFFVIFRTFFFALLCTFFIFFCTLFKWIVFMAHWRILIIIIGTMDTCKDAKDQEDR